MFRDAFCFLVGSGLAFLVSLGFRTREYSTFREWWTEEGAAIWLTGAGIISFVFINLLGL
jgi:hypothetical protein